FAPWLAGTTQTSATYAGAFGHRYAFFSVASDNAGHREAAPTAAQATTTLVQQQPPQARGIIARLVTGKVGKKKKLMVEVDFADTGAKKREFTSPFQAPAFKNIQVRVRDSDGDGVADQVVVTAKKGKKTQTVALPG